MANKKQKREVLVPVECSCGLIHYVTLGLGELQVLERSILKGNGPQFRLRIKTYGPTGRVKNGKPEYVEFNRESQEKSGSLPGPSLPKENLAEIKEYAEAAEKLIKGTRPGTEHLIS